MKPVTKDDIFMMVSEIFERYPDATLSYFCSHFRNTIDLRNNTLYKILGILKREHLKKTFNDQYQYKKIYCKFEQKDQVYISKKRARIILNSQFGNYNLSDIPFCPKAFNAFSRIKITTVNEAYNYQKHLMKIYQCGEKTIDNISNNLMIFLKSIDCERSYCSFRYMLKCILNVNKTDFDIFYQLINSYDYNFQMKSIRKEYKLRTAIILNIKSKIELKLEYDFIQLQLKKFYETVDLAIAQYLIAADARKINSDISIMMVWDFQFYPNTFLNFCSYNERYEVNRKHWIIFSNDNKCSKCDKFIIYVKNYFKNNSEIRELELCRDLYKICRKHCPSYTKSKYLEPQYIRWLINEYLFKICVYVGIEFKYYSKEFFDKRKKILQLLSELKKPIIINKFTELVNKSTGLSWKPIDIITILNNSQEIFFWDICTVISKSNVNYSEEFLYNLVGELIDECSDNNWHYIDVEYFYKFSKEKCNSQNITNSIALYSILREQKYYRIIVKEYPLIQMSKAILSNPYWHDLTLNF